MPVHDGGFLLLLNTGFTSAMPFGEYAFEHAHRVEQRDARRTETPDDVGARVVLLGEQARGDDAGRVADPRDLDVGIPFLERFLVRTELIGLERGVHREFGLLRKRRSCNQCRHRERRDAHDEAAENRLEH
jgi:hypothetical protein